MKCKKAQKLISLYVGGDESWLGPKARQALEAHMAVCEPCRRDCLESRVAIGILREHWQISEDTAALLEGKGRQHPPGVSARVINAFAGSRRVAIGTVAACLAIAVLGWWVVSSQQEQMTGESVFSSHGAMVPTIESLGGDPRIVPGAAIETSAGEMKSLILNGRHQVVMNASTRLSIEPLVEEGNTGCMVNLALGEIYVQVEHDGSPFVVQTAHGRATITGTTFDVRTTQAGTVLVLVEGRVRFESQGGAVQVIGGQRSTLSSILGPPEPAVACDAVALTAWACVDRNASQVAHDIWREDSLPDDPTAFPSAGTWADLKSINYAQWVELNRGWFQRQFPDLFRLEGALTQEGVDVDYPDLLLESAVVWQLAYPPADRDRLLAVDDAAILRAASCYGKGRPWLEDRGLLPVEAVAANEQRRGMEAFSLWRNELAATGDGGKEVPRELLLNSLHACAYLRQTRSLAWMMVEAGRDLVPNLTRAQVQALLQEEVRTANGGVSDVIRLLATDRTVRSCDDDLYGQMVRELSETITQMAQTEQRLIDEKRNHRP